MSKFERSRPSPEASDPARGKFYRLRVEWDPNFGPTSIWDEQVTSLSETAQPIDGGDHVELVLTSDQVRWLHEQLGVLVRALDGARAKRAAAPEVEP